MWKSLKPVLAEMLTSKKFLALLAGALVWALAQADIVATPDQVLPLLGLIATYVAGQGLADVGKSRAKVAADYLGKPVQPPQPPPE